MATNAQLSLPFSVFVTPINEIYIPDFCNHRIRKVLQDGKIVTIAGNGKRGYTGDNVPATSTSLMHPGGVFVTPNNEVYIADTSNNRVRKILQNGDIVTVAGNGKQGYSGDHLLATETSLFDVYSVFVSNNEIYIVDSSNHRIRKILGNGTIITIAGNGSKGYSGDNGPATEAELFTPLSVFVSNNEVYIEDCENNRIRKVLENGTIVTIAGTGNSGFNGDNIPATMANISQPSGIFVTPNNEVYISEYSSRRVRKILQNGNIITIAGNGNNGFRGDNGPAIQAELRNPRGIFVSNNELYIADETHRIRKVLENGNIITIAGTGQSGYNGDSEFDITKYPHIGSLPTTLFSEPLSGVEKLNDIEISFLAQ